ncbi:MAG TPA: MBOAT family protein [Luteolibacter sp.]|nr:MBOAT family protein [Luteolibacter sp.]
MSGWIVVLVCLGIVSGPLLAGIHAVWLRRLLGWFVLALAVAAAHFVLCEAPAFLRMVGICCVLLAGMKGLVYAEWAAGSLPLSWGCYLVFACLWFGMDPGTFRVRKAGLAWKGDLAVGGALLLLGLAGACGVALMGWCQVFIMFLPLSLAFHFGVLRMLKAALRCAGFPVRTLFPNLLLAHGFADFWSQRWNVGYSQMMQRVVGRPIGARCGRMGGLLAVFLISGLLHELAITVPVRAGYGLPTLYFLCHGMLTLLEQKLGRPFGKVFVLAAVILPLGVLFPPEFQREILEPCLAVFGKR